MHQHRLAQRERTYNYESLQEVEASLLSVLGFMKQAAADDTPMIYSSWGETYEHRGCLALTRQQQGQSPAAPSRERPWGPHMSTNAVKSACSQYTMYPRLPDQGKRATSKFNVQSASNSRVLLQCMIHIRSLLLATNPGLESLPRLPSRQGGKVAGWRLHRHTSGCGRSNQMKLVKAHERHCFRKISPELSER
jgi:hypothetical protein